MGELALPNYMSDIVNVGIQKGGIEDAVPQAIRKSQMDKVLLFLTPEEQTTVLNAYDLLDPALENYSEIMAQYPAAVDGETYIRKSLSKEQISQLNPVMGKGLLIVYALEQAATDPAKAAQLGAMTGFDLTKLPAGLDIFAMIQKMPAEQLQAMLSAGGNQISTLDERTLVQAAAAAVRAENTALGADAQKIQTNYILRIGGTMLLISLGVVAAVIVISFLSSRTGSGFARDLRRDIFAKVESFSKAEFETFSTASLITRSTNDITQMQMVVTMILRMALFAPMMAVGAIIRAVEKSPSMTWVIGLGVAVLLLMITIVLIISLPRFRIIQTLIDSLNLVTRESLSGLMVIRASMRRISPSHV